MKTLGQALISLRLMQIRSNGADNSAIVHTDVKPVKIRAETEFWSLP